MTSHTATPLHVIRTIADVATHLDTVPNWQSIPPTAEGAMPLVMVDLRSHDDARAWAAYIGIDDQGSTHEDKRHGEISVSFMGVWLGWRVLVTGRQSLAVEAVAA
jgi:hypothetical protein